jgi:hypothetical protein
VICASPSLTPFAGDIGRIISVVPEPGFKERMKEGVKGKKEGIFEGKKRNMGKLRKPNARVLEADIIDAKFCIRY